MFDIYKLADYSQVRPDGSLFNSYYFVVYEGALLRALDCSTYP